MSDRRERATWWDDLAAVCAAPLKASPRPWIAAAVALALLLGRHESPIATACQVGLGALIGGLIVRDCGFRFATRLLWLLPATTLAAHVSHTPSHFDFGAPLAVATGALVALVGVMSPRRIPVWFGALLVWGGVAAVRGSEVVVARDLATGSLSLLLPHLLALGRPLALAGVALMLRGPTPEERSRDEPRRPTAGAHGWFVWGLAPALALAIPIPPQWLTGWPQFAAGQLHVGAFVTLPIAALAVRVGDHVARQSVPEASAWTRIRSRFAVAPWCASCVVVVLAWSMDVFVGKLVTGFLDTRGTYLRPAVVYGAPEVWSAYPRTLIVGLAVLAHGSLSALRGVARSVPALAVAFVTTGIALATIVPSLFYGTVDIEFVVPWLDSFGIVVALVPLGAAYFVPRRPRGPAPADLALLVVLVAAPVLHRLGSPLQQGGWVYEVLHALTVALLFHRLATCRVRTRALVLAAGAAGVASALLLVGVDVDWLHPLDPRPGRLALPTPRNSAQLKVVPPIVAGWLAALLPLAFARALNAEPKVGVPQDGRFHDASADATLVSRDGRNG